MSKKFLAGLPRRRRSMRCSPMRAPSRSASL
jgi:hypothetical protein